MRSALNDHYILETGHYFMTVHLPDIGHLGQVSSWTPDNSPSSQSIQVQTRWVAAKPDLQETMI